MGALREKMIEEMKLRNSSPRTEQSYVAAMVGLVKHYRHPPDQGRMGSDIAILLILREEKACIDEYGGLEKFHSLIQA